MIIYMLLWPTVFATIRIIMSRQHRWFKFDMDGLHHYDLGFMISLWAAWCPDYCHWIFPMFIFLLGAFLMAHDMVGHRRAAKGLPEEWIFEGATLRRLSGVYRWMQGGQDSTPPKPVSWSEERK